MPMAGVVERETGSYLGYFNQPDWRYEDFVQAMMKRSIPLEFRPLHLPPIPECCF